MDKCRHCDGKGWYYVPNGPDDVDRETCECMCEECGEKPSQHEVTRNDITMYVCQDCYENHNTGLENREDR